MTEETIRFLLSAGAISGAILLGQLIWMTARSRRHLRFTKTQETTRFFIREKVFSIMGSPSSQSLSTELRQLKEYVGNQRGNFDMLSEVLFEFTGGGKHVDEQTGAKLMQIADTVQPVAFYVRLLKKGSVYEKAHACRMLAEYGAEDQTVHIEKFLNAKNKELKYNAAMALSKLGDEDGVSRFVIGSKDNRRMSRRVVLQLLDDYNHDIRALANLVFQECDDYTKANVIKSIAKYGFTEFEPIYLESIRSRNATLRVAAALALGMLGDPKNEPILVRAANDREWIVRNTAVKAIGRINSEKALEVVSRATSDNEWWVRYNAAKTLVRMDRGLEKVDRILSRYDTYASDAVKYALYRDEAASQ